MLASTVTRPLETLAKRFKEISHREGDLTQRIDTSSGAHEIAKIGTEFNTFISQVHKILSSVKKYSAEISDAANQLSNTVGKMGDVARVQNREVTQAVSAINTVTTGLIEVTAQSKSALSQSQGATELSLENTDRAKLAASSIRQLSSEVTESGETIGNLQEQVQSSYAVLDVINSIADQTNLLALNAAIEAARA